MTYHPAYHPKVVYFKKNILVGLGLYLHSVYFILHSYL